jgi:hypothetical protein
LSQIDPKSFIVAGRIMNIMSAREYIRKKEDICQQREARPARRRRQQPRTKPEEKEKRKKK